MPFDYPFLIDKYMMMKRRYEIRDDQWEIIKDFLPQLTKSKEEDARKIIG